MQVKKGQAVAPAGIGREPTSLNRTETEQWNADMANFSDVIHLCKGDRKWSSTATCGCFPS